MSPKLFGDSRKRTQCRCTPEVNSLEGRALLSGVHPHAAAVHAAHMNAHHVAHHVSHHASRPMRNTMHVTVHNAPVTATAMDSPTTTTPLAPGQFGPGTPNPFPGIRPGGDELFTMTPSTGTASDPPSAAPMGTTSSTNNNSDPTTTTTTPLAPGQFGPGTQHPFPGIRPGGEELF